MQEVVIALVIIACMCALFVSQLLPISLVALLAAMAMAFSGILPFETLMAQFGKDTLFSVAGMMIIGRTIYETGIAEVIGDDILKHVTHHRKVFNVLLIICVFTVSMFLSNTAVSSIFIPMTISLALVSKGRLSGRNSVMWIGFASTLGGCGTLVGSPAQHMMAQELLIANGEAEMPFFYGLKASLILLVVMIVYYLVLGDRLIGHDAQSIPDSQEQGEGEVQVKGSKYRMAMSLIALVGAVSLIASGLVTPGVGALIGATFCVLTRVTTMENALKSVSWPTIVMLGSLFAVSEGFNSSGAGEFCVNVILNVFHSASGYVMLAVILFAAVFLTNIADNIAVQALIGPIAYSLSLHAGLDPMAVTFSVLLACNIAYGTPISTPCVSMTLTGGYRFTDYLKVGLPLCVISYIVMMVVVIPLYGI